MKYDVFLSYSSEDKEHMQRVCETLESAGLKVWIDDTGLESGTDNWQKVIEQAIIESACVICVLTPNAYDSKWVRRELAYAELQGKKNYPVHIEGTLRVVSMLNLATTHMVDVRESRLYQPRMEQLIHTIKRNYLAEEQLTSTHPLKHSTLRNAEKEQLFEKIRSISIPENEIHLLLVTKGEINVPRANVKLDQPLFTIGRNDSNTFIVSDDLVSNKHCRFVYTQSGYFLVDLASTNGTYVNDEMTYGQFLRDRDEICIGRIYLRYRVFHS